MTAEELEAEIARIEADLGRRDPNSFDEAGNLDYVVQGSGRFFMGRRLKNLRVQLARLRPVSIEGWTEDQKFWRARELVIAQSYIGTSDYNGDDSEFVLLGGQELLDRLLADPVRAARLDAHLRDGKGGGWLTKLAQIGSVAVIGALTYGIGSAAFGAASAASGATAASVAGAAETAALAETFATGLGGGLTGATVTAGGVATGVTVASAASVASDVKTFADVVGAASSDTAVMFSTAPVTDASLLAAVSPTMGEVAAEMAVLEASNAAILAPMVSDAALFGVSTAISAPVASGFLDSFSIMQAVQKGGSVGTIFDDLSGTFKSVADTAVSAYGSIKGIEVQQAQIDLLNAQQMAALKPATFSMPMTDSGAVNWGVVALGVAAIVAVVLVARS